MKEVIENIAEAKKTKGKYVLEAYFCLSLQFLS